MDNDQGSGTGMAMAQQNNAELIIEQPNAQVHRFLATHKLEDVNNAIESLTKTISLLPQRHSQLPTLLNNLSFSFLAQFDHLGEIEDLDKAVEYQQHVLSLASDGHSHTPTWLDNLGRLLQRRFERLGNLADINMSIEQEQRAILLTPEGHPDLPRWLGNLGRSLQRRFEHLGDLVDLNMAIELQKQALSLTPRGHTLIPIQMDNLGRSLKRRFERLGNLADLDEAIEHHKRAFSLTPKDHSFIPIRLDYLGLSFQKRFVCLGNLSDVETAVEYHQRAVLLTSEGHPHMSTRLGNLGHSLESRFEQLGNLVDLDKAVEHQERALSLTPKGHPHMPILLGNLSRSLRCRFEHLDGLLDLDKAIEHQHLALSLTPEGHADTPTILNNLGSLMQRRFERQGDPTDIDKAVELQRHACALTSVGHPHLAIYQGNLGRSLQRRFERLCDLTDIESAIEHQKQALLLLPEGHLDMPILLDNLGTSLQRRFKRLANLADIDKAIEHQNYALSLTPEGHPDTPIRLSNLGNSKESRFECLGLIGNNSDLDQSLLCYQRAAVSILGRPRLKFQAALQWTKLCEKHQTGSLLSAYKQVMALLPQLVWLGSSVEHRYNTILDVGRICAQAVAAAISVNNYQSALEWLEEGRSIVWKQMLQLRAPLEELSAVDPELAAELKHVAHSLDHSSSHRHLGNFNEPSNEHSLEEAARQHRRLAESWERLINKARKLPGFESFLRPKSASDLVLSAQSGPVVVINVHVSRSDALILKPGCMEISHIPLKRFSNEKATNISLRWDQLVRGHSLTNRAFIPPSRSNVTLESTLAVLWEEVVNPVLRHLGYTNRLQTDNLPHVTWCTTGSLSFLPLHAAGNYGTQSMVYNYIVSSYTPTLSVLLSPAHPPISFSGLLAVGQKSTPGMKPLPGTEAELARIQEQFMGQTMTRLDGDKATPSAVLAGMEQHSWVHLACHAIQNIYKPTESAFHLHGGTLDLATITQKQLKHAELAFLSACETATGDQRLPDEAVHLAAGMLMSGYRTVIATMWSIGDSDAPLVAEKVYEHLLEGGTPHARRAAVAVHKATECLRTKVGVEEYGKWAPYIHIGL